MQEHHLKIQYDGFTVVLVLGGDCSLYQFAAFIIKTVGSDFDHAFEFCDNLKEPTKARNATPSSPTGETDSPAITA